MSTVDRLSTDQVKILADWRNCITQSHLCCSKKKSDQKEERIRYQQYSCRTGRTQVGMEKFEDSFIKEQGENIDRDMATGGWWSMGKTL